MKRKETKEEGVEEKNEGWRKRRKKVKGKKEIIEKNEQ